ncbi:hypothetical protein IFM89_005217 [Coptis chinensis]|uniref:Cytochrome P450 n=1 Tax=Coptis chinensis TaxID=261450 RepID=A0A835H2Y8_9MAGN|nr:hypothetical protein IFM89_005217 [Coptis chinensis]
MYSFHQNLATIFSCVLPILFLYFLLSWKRRTSAKSRFAPEPVGAWPLLGHLYMLSGPKLHITLGSMADKYGPIFGVRLGYRKALVVSNWEVAKECFTTNDRVLASRPSSVAVEIMGYNYGMFGLGPYGSYWREVRKIVMVELLSVHRLELLKHVRISEVSTCTKELYQAWTTNSNNGKTPLLMDMKGWFGDLVLNVTARLVAGKRYFGASAELDDGEARQLQWVNREMFRLFGVFMLADAVPFLRWLDFQGHEKAMRRVFKVMDSIMGRWLKEHKQDKLNRKTKVERDFMDVMLALLDDEKLFGHEADVVTKGTCLTMIIAASDTTMVTLTWALSLLLNNKHVLKKAQDEIDVQVGKDKRVEETDIKNLVYLQAIVKETLRLYPAVPLSFLHEAIEDCTIAGYHVPAGTQVITNISKIQRDPLIWAKPSEFWPERFLTEGTNMDVRGTHFELIPFGSGRRSCPGLTFALQVIPLTLASLLQGFIFETPSGAPVDMTEAGVGVTNMKATPLQVVITPRLPSHLY